MEASLWERFKHWTVRDPASAIGRWVESRVPVDVDRLQGRMETISGDPRWTSEDRMVVAVWQEEQVQKCPNCGTFDWEWEEDPNAWKASIHWCLGCREIQLERREISEGASSDPEGRAGWQVRLMKEANNGE